MEQRRRHRQSLDPERTALGVAHRAQPPEVVGERAIVFVARVIFDHSHHGRGSDEPREVVNVAVGVVAGDSLAEPAYTARADPILELPFDPGAVERWVAIAVE